jgi:hypothetical protein
MNPGTDFTIHESVEAVAARWNLTESLALRRLEREAGEHAFPGRAERSGVSK